LTIGVIAPGDLVAYRSQTLGISGLGVVDVHRHVMETVDEVADGIRRTLEVIPAAHIYVDTAFGLKPRPVEAAKEKVRVVCAATLQQGRGARSRHRALCPSRRLRA